MSDGFQRVAGRCPGCGHEALFLGSGDYVTCSSLDCPDPTAADRVLSDGETEHIVQIEQATFSVLHPLRERGEDLFACDLHQRIAALTGPPVKPGRYRVCVDGKDWRWTAVAT